MCMEIQRWQEWLWWKDNVTSVQQQVYVKCCSSSYCTNLRKGAQMKRWRQPTKARQWNSVSPCEKGRGLSVEDQTLNMLWEISLFIGPISCLTPTNICLTFFFLIFCLRVTTAVSLSSAITPILTFTQPQTKGSMLGFFSVWVVWWGQRDWVE